MYRCRQAACDEPVPGSFHPPGGPAQCVGASHRLLPPQPSGLPCAKTQGEEVCSQDHPSINENLVTSVTVLQLVESLGESHDLLDYEAYLFGSKNK